MCDLSGGGLDLAGILGQLGGVVGQVDTLLSGIENVLNQALDQVLTVTDVFGGSAGAAGVAAQQTGDFCNILNLSLGPIDLDVPLLGVGVHLDNCADGPVTVDVTADPQGGLLGSLLCGIADGVDPAAVNPDQLVGQVNQLIDRLGVLANRLDQLPETTPDIRNMTRHLEKFADRADSLADVDRLLNQVDGLISRTDRVLARLA